MKRFNSRYCVVERNRRNSRRHWVPILTVMASIRLLATGPAAAQTPVVPPAPEALKRMSVEQLMDIEVTSVSKRPEKLFETPSAVQVITGEDLQRSGVSSLPEALRLAPNLEVAQAN